MRALLTDLAAQAGVPEPEILARQLHLLYDGSGQSARMDHDPAAAAAARAAAATLLDAALARGTRPGYSSGWRAMTRGSRPASSQLTTTAISGMPTRIHSRPATGTLSSSESWSSWLVLKKPIAAR